MNLSSRRRQQTLTIARGDDVFPAVPDEDWVMMMADVVVSGPPSFAEAVVVGYWMYRLEGEKVSNDSPEDVSTVLMLGCEILKAMASASVDEFAVTVMSRIVPASRRRC